MSDAERLSAISVDSAEQIRAWVEGTAGPFISEQAPLYAQEVVAWKLWGGISGLIVCLVMVAGGAALSWLSVRLLRQAFKLENIGKYEEAGGFGVGGLFVGLVALGLLVVGVAGIPGEVNSVVKASVAPRMIVLEHLRGLV